MTPPRTHAGRTPLRRLIACLALVLVLPTPTALADSGSLADPSGDFPDIVKLAFNNRQGSVVMAMTYAGSRPQNESFYLRWGRNASKSYQVFVSSTAGLEVLRLNGEPVSCGRLDVTHDGDTLVSRVTVPRSCLPRAPDRLRFRGIATEGLFGSDQTRLSAAIGRG